MKRMLSTLSLALILTCTGCQYLSGGLFGLDQEGALGGGETSFWGSDESGNSPSGSNEENNSSSKNDELVIFEEDPSMKEELPTEGQNFLETKAFTFMPNERSDLFVEEFKADFFNSEYCLEGWEYNEFYNYMPEEIANKYHIHAFEVIGPENVMGTVSNQSRYYLWYEGYITRVDSIGADPEADKGFIHFALTDINGDGFFELLASYTQKRSTAAHFTYATVLDSRSKTALKTSTLYRTYAYFKFDENGTLGLYETAQKGIANNAMLYTEFVENDARYQFAKKEIFLQSKNYDVKVTVELNSIHFPVQFKWAYPSFEVTTEMTYTGEPFTYVNGTNYLDGASVAFKDGENEVSMEGWGAGTVVTTFMVKTGDVITRTYTYYDSHTNRNQEGIYDMIISYHGEKIYMKNFLKISKR